MSKPLGISPLNRERLAIVLRGTKYTITVKEASKLLGLTLRASSMLLAHFATKGWLSRVKQGVYVPVPLESLTGDIVLEDPFIVAEKLYSPCYIAGWSAAEYWGLTEQIFRTIVVYTTHKLRAKEVTMKGTTFLLHKIPTDALFGLKSIWRGQVKVSISDASRTIIDLINTPKFGGGMRHVADMFVNYLKSEYKDLDLLIRYAYKMQNGTVFKRLGFLLELYNPAENQYIDICKNNMTDSKAKLDPALNNNRLITRWKLWVPENWKH